MALSAEAHDLDHQNMTYEHYLSLQSQHDAIRESLSSIRSSSTCADSTTTSPSMSPTRGPIGHAYPNPRRTPPPAGRRDNNPLGTVFDESTLGEIATHESRLLDVNEGIKRALTELLNCDQVRVDKSFRMWVQSRLLETERELRSRRRRRCIV